MVMLQLIYLNCTAIKRFEITQTIELLIACYDEVIIFNKTDIGHQIPKRPVAQYYEALHLRGIVKQSW